MSTNNFIQKATSTPGTFVDSLIFEPGTLGTNTVLLQVPVGASGVATIYVEGIVSASHPGIRLDKDDSDKAHTQLLKWSIDDEVRWGVGMDTSNIDFVSVFEPAHGDIFRFSPGGHAILGPGVSSPTGDATLELSGTMDGQNRQLALRGELKGGEVEALQVSTRLFPSNGNAAFGVLIQPSFQEGTSSQHPRFSSLEVRPPSISLGSPTTATLFDAVSLYISGAPSATVDSGGGNYAIYVGGGTSRFDGMIDLSHISAGSAELKVTATNDSTRVVSWATTETFKVSAPPAGYIKITVGSDSRFIPFWA